MLYLHKKEVLIAPLFLLFFATNIIADNRVDSWYDKGFEYSQQGDNRLAFRWMLMAAKNNHSAAQNNIGLSYLHGLGVGKNSKLAFIWLSKAAKNGIIDAQNELARLYYDGRGTTKNLQKAYYWWLIAANQNDEYAQSNLASFLLEYPQFKPLIVFPTESKP